MDLNWARATPYAIEVDPSRHAFHGGRVVDVLTRGGGAILAAADMAGVWLIATSGEAMPLSERWANPDVQCLAFGPDSDEHVYAGCALPGDGQSVDLLYETDRSKTAPLAAEWRTIPVPPGLAEVNQIAVIGDDRIVLATNDGVYWALIPAPSGSYDWHLALGSSSVRFFSVCVGRETTVIAGAWPAKGSLPLYLGEWGDSFGRGGPPSDLELSPASVPVEIEKLMGRTSVASCRASVGAAGAWSTAYALSVDDKGTPNFVLRSDSGGSIWEAAGDTLTYPPATKTGPMKISNPKLTGDRNSGGYIHRISVSPIDRDVVAFGFLYAYLSTDGGVTWNKIGEWPELGGSAWIHDDVHVVHFDSNDPSGRRLLLASDGGVASTPNLGKTFTDHNEKLANLQMYSTNAVWRGFYGRFDVSRSQPGLVAGGLQDNGNVYTDLTSGTDPWHPLDGHADGAGCFFLDQIGLVRTVKGQEHFWHSSFDPATSAFSAGVSIPLRSATGTIEAPELEGAFVERVARPRFRNPDNQLMYAVGWRPGRVYGLFANDDGSDPGWQAVAAWPAPNDEVVTAAASHDGTEILVATSGPGGAAVQRVLPKVAAVTGLGELGTISTFSPDVLPVDLTGGGANKYIPLLRGSGPRTYFATYTDRAMGRLSGAILATSDAGSTWRKLGAGKIVGEPPLSMVVGDLPDELYFALAVSVSGNPQRLFGCTDRHVYASSDGGTVWEKASRGLPRHAHCSHIEAVMTEDGGTDLYLGTFGWGLWRARVP